MDHTINTLLVALYPHLPKANSTPLLPTPGKKVGRADFLDAVASLCTLQQQCSCAAVAFSISSHGAGLHISASSLPPGLRVQVQLWLRHLRAYIAECETGDGGVPPDRTLGSTLTPAQDAMVKAVYRPSYAGFRATLLAFEANLSPQEPQIVELNRLLETNATSGPWADRIHTLRSQLQSLVHFLEQFYDLNDDNCATLHEIGFEMHNLVDNQEFLKWLDWNIIPYASVILRKCILLYVITRISLTAALSKYVRAALKDGPVEIHLVDLSSPRNVVVDMSPRSLEELWNNIQGLDQQTAIDALQSWSTPPGFTRNGMVYVHPHAEVHCEAALVAHLQASGVNAYEYIGCSRSPCYCCRKFVQAVNGHFTTALAFRSSRDRDIRLDLPWTMPTSTSQAVKEAFCNIVIEDLKWLLCQFLVTVRQRRMY